MEITLVAAAPVLLSSPTYDVGNIGHRHYTVPSPFKKAILEMGTK